MFQPLVSIIIPTLNRANLIVETLDSVLAQTYGNWECIVVDDGSTDETEEVLAEYIIKDKRIQYHQRPTIHKPGGNGARNYGFNLSKGEYIQWFDSDDIMFPDYLKNRLDVFYTFPASDVVFCSFTYFDINGLKDRIRNENFTGDIINDLAARKISFSPLSYLLKKKCLEGFKFDEALYRAQDLDFFFRVFTSSKSIKIEHVKTVLFKVRKYGDKIGHVDDKLKSQLNSRYIVNRRILDYFFLSKNSDAEAIYKRECLYQLKKILETKNYSLVIRNIKNFPYLNFIQKVYLILCVLTEIVFGRGSNQFKTIITKR